jgi:cytochrome c553
MGILPGSPAQRQPVDRTPPTPVSQVVWTPDVLQILARANPERGRAKAMEVCVSCHGEQGVSVSAEFPHLAGQSGAAIYKQLHDYRTGSRTHELMTDLAKALEEPMIADVAAYYAGQPQRRPNPATLAGSAEQIVRLVELGDPARNIPPCASCHWPGSGGPVETPSYLNSIPNIWCSRCRCMLPVSGEMTSMAACELSRQSLPLRKSRPRLSLPTRVSLVS